MSLLADDSHLIILHGQVADDSDDEDLPVGKTFWHFPEVFYFDHPTHSLRRAPEGCWVNCIWDIMDIKYDEVKGKVKLGKSKFLY